MATPKTKAEIEVDAKVERLARELELPASATGWLRDALTAKAMLSVPPTSKAGAKGQHTDGSVAPATASLPNGKSSWLERAGFTSTGRGPSAVEQLGALVAADAVKRAEAKNADCWKGPLVNLCGVIDDDGVERITTQAIFDVLEIPLQSRSTAAGRRLAAVMRELGWSQVKMHAPTRRGYKERVRGYCRIISTKEAQGYARDARHVRVAAE
jgi:hypothetical protein